MLNKLTVKKPVSNKQQRGQTEHAGWTGPLVMTFLMTVLASLASLNLMTYFAATGSSNLGEATVSLINVWNTLLYIPMLVTLAGSVPDLNDENGVLG